jgi:hypothetical protein
MYDRESSAAESITSFILTQLHHRPICYSSSEMESKNSTFERVLPSRSIINSITSADSTRRSALWSKLTRRISSASRCSS